MANAKLKREYIGILLDQVQTLQMLSQLRHSMEENIQEIYYHPTLYKELTASSKRYEEKEALLQTYIKDNQVPLLAESFLKMLLHRGHFFLIDDQDKPTLLSMLRESLQEIRVVQLTVADYLSDYMLNALHGQLQPLLHYAFVFDVNVDPAIISGLVIQTDSFVYSDTAVDRLEEAKDRIKERIHDITQLELQSAIQSDFQDIRQKGGGVS